MEGGSDIAGILEGVEGKLPAADFSIGELEEDLDSDASEGSGGVSVFSRSQHLSSAGLQEDTIENGQNLDTSKHLASTAGTQVMRNLKDDSSLQDQGTSSRSHPLESSGDTSSQESVSVTVHSSREASCAAEVPEESAWLRFKSDFTNTLESSEQQVEAELTDSNPSMENLRQQLLVEAIRAMHLQTDEQPNMVQASESDTDAHIPVVTSAKTHSGILPSETGDTDSQVDSSLAPASRQTGLLTTCKLETIHELEVDRLLEVVETEAVPPRDEREMPNGDSHPPPQPSIVWDIGVESQGSSEQLMRQLEQLSRQQATGETRVSLNTPWPHGDRNFSQDASSPSHSETAERDGENPTVFLDLRPGNERERTAPAADTVSSSAQRLLALRGSQDGVEDSGSDSDDPYSWITQRQQLKTHAKSSTEPPSSTPGPSRDSHQSPITCTSASQPKVPEEDDTLLESLSWKELLEAAPQGEGHMEGYSEGRLTQNTLKEEATVSTQATTVTSFSFSSQARQVPVKEVTILREREVSSSLSKEEHTASSQLEEKGPEIGRQRSEDSLTLSSSLSEGEVPLEQSGGTSAQVASSKPPPGNKGKKASTKKHAKKPKKSKKSNDKKQKVQSQVDDKGTTPTESKGQKKRPQLQRLRSDSLTTSSDEEHTPEVALTRRLPAMAEEVFSPVTPTVETSVIVDVERLKSQLQQKIKSRKPPSPFETPATEPIFHQDVSFDPSLTLMDPTIRTDALLVLPLSANGSILLPPSHSNLDIQTQQVFHSLLLTWLVSTATGASQSQGAINPSSQTEDAQNHHLPQTTSPLLKLPFRITGMQQTVFDGSHAILVSITISHQQRDASSSSEAPSSDTPTVNQTPTEDCYPSLQDLEAFFRDTTFAELFQKVLANSSVQQSILPLMLQQLDSVLQLPLDSILSLQEDHSPLTTPISFYWHSSYHPSCLPSSDSFKSCSKLQTTVCTVGQHSFSNISLVFSLFHNIWRSGLDLAGARFVYGQPSHCVDIPLSLTDSNSNPRCATLALAIRGPDAIYRWQEVIGPEDSSLAKITNPSSLSAVFGVSGKEGVHCIRTPYRISAALAKWFGGRACLKTGSVLGISDARTKSERRKRQRVRFSESESEDNLPSPLPDVTFPPLISNRPLLTAQSYSKVILVVSPHIPPSCYSTILASCSSLGYDIFGNKRVRLNSKRAKALHISPTFIAHFTPSSTPPSPAMAESAPPSLTSVNLPPLPSMLLILGRENAAAHTAALQHTIVADLSRVAEMNPVIRTHLGNVAEDFPPDAISHASEYADEALNVIGNFTTPPSSPSAQPELAGGWDEDEPLQEEICFVAVTQSHSLPKLLEVSNTIFNVKPPQISESFSEAEIVDESVSVDENDLDGIELIGMKLIPQLSRYHAKQLCPYSTSDHVDQQAIQILSAAPAVLLVFRGIQCNSRLQKVILLQKTKPSILERKLKVIVAPSFQKAFHLASIFFANKELFCDPANWALASFIPHSRVNDSGILQSFQRDPECLYSVLTVKADQGILLVKILEKLHRAGFNFVGLTLQCVISSVSELEDPVPKEKAAGVIAICVERVNAVWYLEHELRPFELSSASYKKSLSYSHSFASAVEDIRHYFPNGLCCQPTTITKDYKIACPAYDDFGALVVADTLAEEAPSSPLLETTCIILPLSMQDRKHVTDGVNFITTVELISQAGFKIHGLKMSFLSKQTARAVCYACPTKNKMELLCRGPCLVMVLTRDNAASCFQLIMKSAAQSHYRGNLEDISELLEKMVVPSSAKEANQVVELLRR